MARVTEPTAAAGDDVPDDVVPMRVGLSTLVVVRWGLALWAVVLVVLVAVPDLRTGDRWWWVWVPVAALALGALGYYYVRRGRGNAVSA